MRRKSGAILPDWETTKNVGSALWDTAEDAGSAAWKATGDVGPAAWEIAQDTLESGADLVGADTLLAKEMEYGKGDIPRIFTDRYEKNPNQFWADLKKNTGYDYGTFVDRFKQTSENAGLSMSDMHDLFAKREGGQGMPSMLHEGFTNEEGDVRWDRVKGFMDQMPDLMSGWGESDEGHSQMVDTLDYFRQVSENAPGDFNVQQVQDYIGGEGGDNELSMWEDTDSGPQFQGKNVLRKMHDYRKAFEDADLDPEDTGKLLGKATDVLGEFGEPGRKLVNQYMQESGKEDGNLADRVSMARDLVNTTHEMTKHMDKMDIDPQRALGVAVELSPGSKFDPDNMGVVEDLMEVTADSEADVGRMLEKDRSGQPQILNLMDALPGGNLEESSPVEMIKKRYYDEEGNLQEDKFRRDVEGFSNSYDNIMNLTKNHGPLLKEYSEDIEAGDSSSIVKQFVDEKGNVDWDAVNSSTAFYDKMFNFLEANPDKKEQFDQLTKHGSGLKGVGFLKGAKDKIIEKAPDLFMDSEGNFREDAASIGLTLASWGQSLFRKLFEEKDPMAWLGVAGAAATAASGLRFLFGGGGGQQQQQQQAQAPAQRQAPVYRSPQAQQQVTPQRQAQPRQAVMPPAGQRRRYQEPGTGWQRYFE